MTVSAILDGLGEVSRSASNVRECRERGGCYVRAVPGQGEAFEAFLDELRVGREVSLIGGEAIITFRDRREEA